MENKLADITNNLTEITTLNKTELLTLFKNANTEAEKLEFLLFEIVDAYDLIERLEAENQHLLAEIKRNNSL